MKDKTYWKSFEELAQDPKYLENAQREFIEEDDGSDFLSVSRRKFLKLLGASVALATTSCRRPVHKIFPYVKATETLKPGLATYYASTFALNHHSYGVLVKTLEGRPIKIEGNPDHPLSHGAAGTWAQASLLELYDPARKRNPTIQDRVVNWEEWDKEIVSLLLKSKKVRFLTESNPSLTFNYLLKQFLRGFPNARWDQYESVSQENARLSMKKAFGRTELPKAHLDKANIIFSINSDFLGSKLDSLIHIKNWAQGRKVRSPKDTMNRLYVLESFFSTTGATADHRLSAKPSQLLSLALELVKILDPSLRPLLSGISDHGEKTYERAFLTALAEDLLKNKGKALVMVGEQESIELQVVGHYLNTFLGSFETTLDSRISTASFDNGHRSLEPLLSELKSGSVDTLIMIGGNPVYQLGAEFSDLLKKVPHTIRLSLYEDETTEVSTYAAPLSHFLESWGDSRPEDGLVSLIQPTIRPLHNSRSAGEMIVSWFRKMAGETSVNAPHAWLDEIKTYWKQNIYPKKNTLNSFESFWQGALQDGVVTEPLPAAKSFNFNTAALAEAVKAAKQSKTDSLAKINSLVKTDSLEIQLTVSPTLFDGRFANVGSLQELPDPVTKVTWDNVAALSPKTALKYGLKQGNKIELSVGSSTVTLPVFLQPGLSEDVITSHIGYGRSQGGEVGTRVGATVFVLGHAWQYKHVGLKKVAGRHKIATTQSHHSMEGRPIILEATLEEYKKHPDFPKHETHTPELLSLYKDHAYTGYKWGMAIDLNSCVGCSGCVVACDVENNIPTVGKPQVLKGREMQWLRLDRYYETSSEHEVKTLFQPMLCQHCENAPCESVCPVSATVHSEEGLNQMTYNRCVGTRYCSNNCPYKVRRFNYFDFNAHIETPQELGKNPDVTIRMRGVMEKCTFCVQRISEGKNGARMRGEKVADGEIQTACQQACPSQAIVFGDLNDPNSDVSKLSRLSHGYRVLEELNVRPSITYLAKIRNPNPKLEKYLS